MVSIIIVNWNSGSLLERCVLSLEQHASGCEIIVIDNASEDFSLDFASRLNPPIVLVRNEENLGFAAGNNLGWRRSAGKHVLFLNPDIEARPDAVVRLARVLDGDPGVWAVGGKLISPTGRRQSGFNVRSFPSVGTVAAEMLLWDELWPGNPWTRRYRMSSWDHNSVRAVDQPAAACLMVRREALERLDGFDESFHPAWFEDVDFCRRTRNGGGRILFEPGAEFLHHGGSSLKHLAREQFLEYFHRNQLRYFHKHHGEDAARRVRRLIAAGMYLRAGFSFIFPLIEGSTRLFSARTFWRTARYFSKVREVGR